MNRHLIAAATATVALAVPTAAPLAAPAAASAKTLGAQINLKKTHKGSILFNSKGYVLYAFTPDKKNKDVCVKISQCLSLWPIVSTKATPRAGKGVNQHLLGKIKVGHSYQVTYAGHPLYTYVPDSRGETDNINIFQFGGFWPAVAASGKLVK